MNWDFHPTFGRDVLIQNETSKFGITSTFLAMVCLNSTLSRLFTESLDASTRLEKINTTKTLHAHFLHSRAATAWNRIFLGARPRLAERTLGRSGSHLVLEYRTDPQKYQHKLDLAWVLTRHILTRGWRNFHLNYHSRKYGTVHGMF